VAIPRKKLKKRKRLSFDTFEILSPRLNNIPIIVAWKQKSNLSQKATKKLFLMYRKRKKVNTKFLLRQILDIFPLLVSLFEHLEAYNWTLKSKIWDHLEFKMSCACTKFHEQIWMSLFEDLVLAKTFLPCNKDGIADRKPFWYRTLFLIKKEPKLSVVGCLTHKWVFFKNKIFKA
jgi:hypothetical protein